MKGYIDYFFPVYKNLEQEVLELAKYIQFDDKQIGVYSLHIADLIIRCAMEIEAISKELYWNNGGEKVYSENGEERKLYFDTDCIDYLDKKWGICDKELIVSSECFYFVDEKIRLIKPLKNINKRGRSKWGKAYQAVKHDRKESIKQGNIENLILALGALYILNLYHMDKTLRIGTIISFDTQASAFDIRMGSSIFSVTTADATKVPIGKKSVEDVISNELMEKCRHAIYIFRYTKESWMSMNKAVSDDAEELFAVMKKSGALDSYEQTHGKFEPNSDESIFSIANKVMGEKFYKSYQFYKTFGIAFNNAIVEAILDKRTPIYEDVFGTSKVD